MWTPPESESIHCHSNDTVEPFGVQHCRSPVAESTSHVSPATTASPDCSKACRNNSGTRAPDRVTRLFTMKNGTPETPRLRVQSSPARTTSSPLAPASSSSTSARSGTRNGVTGRFAGALRMMGKRDSTALTLRYDSIRFEGMAIGPVAPLPPCNGVGGRPWGKGSTPGQVPRPSLRLTSGPRAGRPGESTTALVPPPSDHRRGTYWAGSPRVSTHPGRPGYLLSLTLLPGEREESRPVVFGRDGHCRPLVSMLIDQRG